MMKPGNADLLLLAQDYHSKALDHCEMALMAKICNVDDIAGWYEKAFEYESKAANLAIQANLEPSRSVLCRSAATLACDCKKYDQAQKYVELGLASSESVEEIRQELLEVSKRILKESGK